MPSIATWTLAALAAVQVVHAAPQGVSSTARCGAQYSLTCKGSSFGNCCSKNGWCGSSNAYCGDGCQSAWGTCSSAASTPPAKISRNGSCAQNGGTTCLGSSFGDCCSQYGYCGSSRDYCSKGCNPLFGKCNGAEPTPSSTPAVVSSAPIASLSPTMPVARNSRCGTKENALPQGQTCRGSAFGDCCSKWGYCGSSKDYCGTGCQPAFGKCDAQPVSSSITSSVGSTPAASSAISSSAVVSSNSVSASIVSTPTASSSVVDSSTAVSSMISSSIEPPSSVAESASASSVAPSLIISSSPVVPPSCTPNPSFQPSGQCNYQGFPSNAGSAYLAKTGSSLEGCKRLCFNSAPCRYLVSQDTNCYLYNRPPSESGELVTTSRVRLYERTCFPSTGACFAEGPVSASPAASSSIPSAVSSSAIPPSAVSSPAVSSSGVSSSIGSSDTLLPPSTSSSAALSATSSGILSVATPTTSIVVSSDISGLSSSPTASSSSFSITYTPVSELFSASSSIVASETPLASSTVNCYAAPTNFVSNGDFESASGISPWTTQVLRGGFSALEQSTVAQSGSYGFRATVRDTTNSAVFINQPSVTIPAGTQIVASFWVKFLVTPPVRGSGTSMSVQMYMDSSQELADAEPVGKAKDTWYQIVSNPITLTGTSHVFQVYFGAFGYTGPILAFDNISIRAVAGPPGQPLCT